MAQSQAVTTDDTTETGTISIGSDNRGPVDLSCRESRNSLSGKVRCASCGREFWPDGQRKKFCDHACYSASLNVPIEQRFWSKVKVGQPDDCWLWTGATTVDGYGQIAGKVNGKRQPLYAHRLAWEWANGPILDGLSVLHRCDVPACVNVQHLFLGTQQDNLTDARQKGRLDESQPRTTARFTPANRLAIFKLKPRRGLVTELARRHGVSKACISVIRRGRFGRALAVVFLLLFCAPSAHAQQAPTLALLAGSGFDLGTTLYDLHAIPGGHEANPFLSHGGTLGLIAVKSGATALLVVAVNRLTHQGHPRIATVIGWTSGIVFSGVAVRNLRVGR